MERLEKFVQSLLLLLTAIHMTAACNCSMLTWEALLCPPSNKTVVIGRLISSSGELYNQQGHYIPDVSTAVQGRYQMYLNLILKNGSFPLLVISGQMTMVFPTQQENCGHHFTENEDYVIGGDVNEGGILSSSKCEFVMFYTDVIKNVAATKLLLGEGQLNCENL